MRNTNKKGFTIVELVIVVAVIAILAAVLIPTFSGIINKANRSADQQAVHQMNTHLAVATAIGEVNSILDVYEVFADSGLTIKNYASLANNTQFYYDKQYNEILYVDTTTNTVIYPEHRIGDSQGNHDWYSLSMEIETMKINPTETEESGVKVYTYSVSAPEQYAYIAETLSNGWPTDVSKIVINITENIDFKGAYVIIDEIPDNVEFVLDGGNHTIKNITSNTFESLGDTTGVRKYIAAALIGKVVKSDVTIQNVVFENINVKDINTGNVALLIGQATGSSGAGNVTISNVDINNSTVIGHRSTGALVGMLYSNTYIDDVNLNGVNVCTVGGRSGLLYGFVSMASSVDVTGYTATNTTLSIYECEQNAGGIKNYTGTTVNGENATKDIHSYSVEENGTKEERDYGFNENALYCINNTNDTNKYYLFVVAE